MDVKLNKPSSVFKELSGLEHLLTEEVTTYLFQFEEHNPKSFSTYDMAPT